MRIFREARGQLDAVSARQGRHALRYNELVGPVDDARVPGDFVDSPDRIDQVEDWEASRGGAERILATEVHSEAQLSSGEEISGIDAVGVLQRDDGSGRHRIGGGHRPRGVGVIHHVGQPEVRRQLTSQHDDGQRIRIGQQEHEPTAALQDLADVAIQPQGRTGERHPGGNGHRHHRGDEQLAIGGQLEFTRALGERQRSAKTDLEAHATRDDEGLHERREDPEPEDGRPGCGQTQRVEHLMALTILLLQLALDLGEPIAQRRVESQRGILQLDRRGQAG